MLVSWPVIEHAAAWLDVYVGEIARRLRQDLWIYAVILVHGAVGIGLLWASGNGAQAAHAATMRQWIVTFLVFMPALAAAFDIARVRYRCGRRSRLAYQRVFSAKRLAHGYAGLILLMALMLFQGTFTSIKNVMPVLRGGFPYDRYHADIDAWLHFGHDPWRMLVGAGHDERLRLVVEWNYGAVWFMLCFGALFFVVTSPAAAAVRVRYMAMFLFVWVVCGNLLAGMFLSAGPVFYGAVTGDTARFADEMRFIGLGQWPGSAAAYQRYLWTLYQHGVPGLGSGISAFPSVHVALVTMNAFFVMEYSKRLGIAAFAYVGLILVSSVYLGWHYAIDGYASLLVVALAYCAMRAAGASKTAPAVARPPGYGRVA